MTTPYNPLSGLGQGLWGLQQTQVQQQLANEYPYDTGSSVLGRLTITNFEPLALYAVPAVNEDRHRGPEEEWLDRRVKEMCVKL